MENADLNLIAGFSTYEARAALVPSKLAGHGSLNLVSGHRTALPVPQGYLQDYNTFH